MTVETDLALIGYYDQLLPKIEYYIDQCAKQHDPDALCRLRTMPGIGYILALAILYEVGDISRFKTVQDFSSYARLIRPEKESDDMWLEQLVSGWGSPNSIAYFAPAHRRGGEWSVLGVRRI